MAAPVSADAPSPFGAGLSADPAASIFTCDILLLILIFNILIGVALNSGMYGASICYLTIRWPVNI